MDFEQMARRFGATFWLHGVYFIEQECQAYANLELIHFKRTGAKKILTMA